MSAVFSDCGLHRLRLDRDVAESGLVFLFVGVNPSRAAWTIEDQTSLKWRYFTKVNGGRKYIAVNPFSRVATDVKELASFDSIVHADNYMHVAAAIKEADIIVPCWGARGKLPAHLREHLDYMAATLRLSGKPIRIFGLTKSGDPMHPLMLSHSTALRPWPAERPQDWPASV